MAGGRKARQTNYDSGDTNRLSQYEVPSNVQQRRDDVFEQTSRQYESVLRDLQIVLVIDRSGSMRIPDEDYSGKRKPGLMGGEWTRWDNTFQLVKDLSESIFQYDKDSSIPVIFFGEDAVPKTATSIPQLYSLCQQHAPTNETTNLLAALRLAFIQNIDSNNTLFIVLTDGCPNHGQESKVKELIYEMVTKQDPSGDRVNVLFVRVGDDSGAIAFLEDMDDCARIGESVDTKSDNEAYAMGPRCLILNAIYEHLEGNMAQFGLPSSSSSRSISSLLGSTATNTDKTKNDVFWYAVIFLLFIYFFVWK